MENAIRGELQSKMAFCGCGKLHFTYGPITLHFDRSEFLTFADSVGRLGALLRQSTKESAIAPSHVPNATICH
ncbi:MAG TPA: hypothetical protein VK901_08025 [Nitrospiraceae bacterium]|nr:hypothetical protein [Nitrospiraceae bacterium]